MGQEQPVRPGPPPGDRKREERDRQEHAVDRDRDVEERPRVLAVGHGLAPADADPPDRALDLAARRELLVGEVRSDSQPDEVEGRQDQGGMDASELKRVKDLERELCQLKRMYAELSLENNALKDLISKKL